MEPTVVTVQDTRGESHTLSILPFEFEEGMALLATVSDIGAETIGPVTRDGATDADVLAALAKLPQQILRSGGMPLVGRLLARTKRRTVDEATGKETWQNLGDRGVRALAYQDNYMECFETLFHVLRVNFGPFMTALMQRFNALSPSVNPQLQSLQKRLPGIDQHET